MKLSRYSPASASMICSSCPVPSVATQKACVSPRVNSAEPCARGSTPTSATIGRTVLVSRPSMRLPVSRIALRTTSASRSLSSALAPSVSAPSAVSCSTTAFLAAPTFSRRTSFCVSRYASAIGSRPSSAMRVFSAASAAEGSGRFHGSFAARSASSMMPWMTGWKPSWPKVTAPSMTSSGSSCASDSTISTPSCVPATTRSSALCLRCAVVGLSTYCPST